MEQVLDAADTLLATRGYEGFTIRAVSEECGVSVPAIYQWFADRDELAGVLLERQMADLEERIAAIEATAREGDVVRDVIQRVMATHLEYYRATPSHVELWFRGRVTPQVVEWVHHHYVQLAQDMHVSAIEKGLLPPGTDPLVHRVMIEAMDRIHELAFRENPKGDEAIIDIGFEMIDAYHERLNHAKGG